MDIEQRLREAHPNSQQYALGSDILLEAADRIKQLDESNEFLKGELKQLANFNPDWDQLKTAREALQEVQVEHAKSVSRVTELEKMLSDRLELIRCGVGGNYSGDPKENELYTSVVELLKQ